MLLCKPVPEPLLTFCVGVLGIGAWIAVSGIFAELPVLVLTQPEGWALASTLSLVVQLGNIGPLIYSIFHHYGHDSKQPTTIINAIRACLVTATLACFLAIFLYSHTTPVGNGHRKSIALFTLAFFASISDATTTVTYMPLLGLLAAGNAALHSVLAQSLMIGEGLSGLIPVAITWIQIPKPSSTHTTFGPDIFFVLLTLQMVAAAAAFVYIVRWWYRHPSSTDVQEGDLRTALIRSESTLGIEKPVARPLMLLVALAVLSFFMNGALPAIIGYAANRYGQGAYHTAQSLLLCANPIAAATVMFHPPVKECYLYAALAGAIACSLQLITLASNSANDSWGSGGCVYTCVTLASFLLSWVKTNLLAKIMQKQDSVSRSKTLFAAGVAIQIGSFLGALLFYILVNHTDAFG
eukprot:TRINITY_DN9000_c0_g1_i3.p1 TRINITY_DN9000_c0_g1~~TRINITY_DN9000_c0_g1_i3.p1  ORF type:complete len:409 (+),score=30.70 TRINITY_DN9000_c0_g1_i3:86-1312(+)